MKTLTGNIWLIIVLLAGMLAGCEVYPVDQDREADPRDPFTGYWTVTEYSEEFSTFTYPVNITKDPSNGSRLIMENFGYTGFDEKPPYGILSGATVTIPQQTVCNDNSMVISGSGQLISANSMQWNYTIIIGGNQYDYTAKLEKSN